MADAFLSEIRIFAAEYVPRFWCKCDGSLLQKLQNSSLFALLGTRYGGDGFKTFGVPNLQGNAAMHFGQRPGLTDRKQGAVGGTQTVTLTTEQMASHTHLLTGGGARGATPVVAPGPSEVLTSVTDQSAGVPYKEGTSTNLTAMSTSMIDFNGGGGPHNNVQPYLGLPFIMCLQGLDPRYA